MSLYRNVERNLPVKTFRVYFRAWDGAPIQSVDIVAERPESAMALAYIDMKLPKPHAVEQLDGFTVSEPRSVVYEDMGA